VANFVLDHLFLRDDGEGLTHGQAVPGWTLCDPGCASVTATTVVKKVGAVGIRVNGDNHRYKPLAATLFGDLDVNVWMFPATDSNTNFNLVFGSDTSTLPVNIRINETNTWFLTTASGTTTLAAYNLNWTKVRLVLHTSTESVDVFINDVQVASGISAPGLGSGVGLVGTHSGRGGAGHDSYFDQLVISRWP
jgi:hypothetical protein